ncbi:MAG: topoisomerase IV [Clostridia bacterium]|nr:topoisomerase IV [Clostridia bacterium]
MARKKKQLDEIQPIVYAPAVPQLITETIEKNYMPYTMSVIVSRAIPEIDGFKPAHRKILYTMYNMGLLKGPRTKSANIVGAVMKLHPHGDQSIYETMVRLTRGNETLLHPFVDSKGSFGKQYSSDMKFAAPRYTEAKLDSFCTELFEGIDKNAVDMVDNYDGTMKEPQLLPTTFPNILVTPNSGIAVGMASDICSFNLSEICDGTIAVLKKPNIDVEKVMEIIKAPDFPGGGQIIYDAEQMRQIFESGDGSFKIRSRYSYDASANCIDILQIPYTTTIEQILNKISVLVKEGKLKEVVDFRDEIDRDGFKLTLDLRKGTDPDKLMQKLFKITPLESSFKCNFNIIIDGEPRQLGVVDIISEWIDFRKACLTRELKFDLGKKKDKLHLLLGLGKILLDIDKAIRIIRKTEKEEDVIPNLCEGFSIDEIQANYIAEIKLRNLNREYIINRISEIEDLKAQIAEIEEILKDEYKLKALIAKQLTDIKKKYGQPRRTQLIGIESIEEYVEEDSVENYPCKIVLSREGYFKKITLKSLQGNDEQRFKEGDGLRQIFDAENKDTVLFFTDKAQLYRAAVADFDNSKASVIGDFLPSELKMDPGERPVYMTLQKDFRDGYNYVYIFENGKGVRIPEKAYETSSVRRKLKGIFSSASPIVAVFSEQEKNPFEIMLVSSEDRAIIIKTSLIPLKSTKTSIGVQLINVKKNHKLTAALANFESVYENTKGYRKLKLPATGVLLSEKDINKQQISIEDI